MISVSMLGGAGGCARGVARYYLTPDQGCGIGYYTEHDQVPGRWLGHGAERLGLRGPLEADGAARLVRLLKAEGPDGQVLTRPLWRPDPAGRLPSAPLLVALEQGAVLRGVPLDELLTDPVDRATLLGIVRRSGGPGVPAEVKGRLASPLATPVGPLAITPVSVRGGWHVDAAVAKNLANAVGLDPVEVFRASDGTDRFTPALAKVGARVDTRRVGIDVTVSAPKSVSLLQALADPEMAALIEACHDRAVQQALGYLQRKAGHGFRGHHGDGQAMDRVGTDGWIVAGFTHFTSRAGDPQLHTHLVVPNLLHGTDGKWSAIDSRAVYRQAKTAGFLYQAALRHELSRELGVGWTEPVKGLAEIKGVPREVLRAFSQRRRQIETALARSGKTGRNAAQAACLATRQRKQHTPAAVRRESWQQRALALGTSPGELLTAAGIKVGADGPSGRFGRRLRASRSTSRALELSPAQLANVAALVLGPDGVTAKTTCFDRRDLLQALAVTVPVEHTGNAIDLERLADHLLRQPATVHVGPGAEDEPRWTTLDLLTNEHRALTFAAGPSRLAGPSAESVETLLAERAWLSEEQQTSIRHLTTDPRLATVLVGPAGSGKTAALAAIRDLAEQNGQPVIGCSLAALTAQRLQQGSGITSSSLAQLLHHLDTDPAGLARGTVVVVDEAGMVGTRQLCRLLEHVNQAGGRLLLVGDPAQLPEIDAGGLFRHLSQPQQRPAVLRGNQRQQHEWEVLALDQLRGGQHVAALSSYARRQRITLTSDRDQLHERVAADYLVATAAAESPAGMRETVVLASQHVDVDALNTEIRRGLQQQGRLGPDTLTLELSGGPTGFAAGDQVIITRPCLDEQGRKVLNGTRGELISAGVEGLRVQSDTGTAFTLSPETAVGGLRHGYALTIHKAQGLTAENALVVSDGLTRNAAYTAMSRGRQRNQLYLHTDFPKTGIADWQAAFGRLCQQLDRPTGDTLASSQIERLASPLATARDYPERDHLAHRQPDDRTLGV